jgi:hypothetical protein
MQSLQQTVLPVCLGAFSRSGGVLSQRLFAAAKNAFSSSMQVFIVFLHLPGTHTLLRVTLLMSADPSSLLRTACLRCVSDVQSLRKRAVAKCYWLTTDDMPAGKLQGTSPHMEMYWLTAW